MVGGVKHGPSMTRLIAMAFSKNAIPSGGGVADGMAALMPDRFREGMKKAEDEALKMMQAVKSVPENPFGDNNEAIAEYIVELALEEKMERWKKKRANI